MRNPFSKEIEFSSDLFVGRKREVWSTLDRLANPQNRGSSAVYGETGIGKTWFLEYLKQADLLAEWELEEPRTTIISVNCKEINPWKPEIFWQKIWQQVQAKNIPASEQKIIGQLFKTSPSDNLLIGQLLDQIVRNDRFLILLLDDFDWIIEHVDIENPPFLNALRSFLVRMHKGLGIVLTTARPLHDLCASLHFDVSPFDNVFYPIKLKRFNEKETSNFTKVRLKETDIRFTEAYIQSLLKVSQGHPDRLSERLKITSGFSGMYRIVPVRAGIVFFDH